MKNIVLIICLLLTCQTSNAQYWKAISSGTNKKLLSVSFGTPNTGYISGADSLILKTTDGGLSWAPLSYSGIDLSASVNDIIDINFVDSLIGFATVSNIDFPSYNGTIFKTTDGGATWYNVSTVNMVNHKTFFFDEFNGYQVGSAFFSGLNVSKYTGSVWVSPDWTELNNFSYEPSEFLQAIDFRNKNVGIVGGDGGFVFRTFDAGITWDTVKTITDSTINELLYLNDSTIIAATDKLGNSLIMSKDSGKNWIYDVGSIIFDNPAMKAMVLTNADSLIVVGQSVSRGKGLIFDFHGSTTINTTYTDQNLNDVNKATADIVFIVGDSGLILSNRASVLSIPNTQSSPLQSTIFPNPAQQSLYTQMAVPHQVALYNMLGKMVFTEPTYQKQHYLSLSSLQPGLYMVALRTNSQQTVYHKLMLQ